MNGTGEMPFLDHLEELRTRIIRVLGVLIATVLVALWAVHQFKLVLYLQQPILPYLPEGQRLVIQAPFEALMIELRLGLIAGLILASPVIFHQVWGFLAPALYQREKRAVLPVFFVGMLLFLAGCWASWTWIVPLGLDFAMNYGAELYTQMITFEFYFDTILRIVLALGLSMELPLVMFMLAWAGIADVALYRRMRRYAIVLNTILGAIIAPGPDALSAMAAAVPLIGLYELGVASAAMIERRRKRAAAREAAREAAAS